MRIGLFGFTAAHENLGCQALTYSFLSMLRELLPDDNIEIVIFGFEKTLGTLKKDFPEFKFALCSTSLKKRKPYFVKVVKTCDLIFDETYGDGFSDIYFGKKMYVEIFKKYLAIKNSKTFVFTPQTIGPFYRKPMELLAAKTIKKATHVFTRDEISADYATKISKRKVKSVTDLAFALPYKRETTGTKKKFGLNVSGLLWNGGFGDNKNQFGLKVDYKEYCRKMIEYALSKDYEVHLIAHVTKTADLARVIPDGDLPACQVLKEEYPDTILSPGFESPLQVKNYISNMEIFIGARMHATIAAFSSGVVTIPFAYSRKFKGLYENVDYSYYVDGTVMNTDECVETTKSYIENMNDLKESQQKSMENVRNKLADFKNDLMEIIG